MPSTTTAQRFEQALQLGRQRRYREAADLLGPLAAEDHPEALLYLGRALHGLGQFNQAVTAFQAWLRQNPASGPGHFFLGRSLLAAGAPAKAIAHFHRSRKHGFASLQMEGLLGTAYLKAKNPELAVETLQKAVEAAPRHRGIYIAYLNALFVQAVRCFQRHDFDMSRQILQFLTQAGATSTAVQLYLAHSFKEQGRFEEALTGYREAQKESPGERVITFLISEMLFALGRSEEARAELAKVQDLLPPGMSPSTQLVWNKLLPWQYFRSKNYRQALFYTLKNLKAEPDNADLNLLAGECQYQLGQKDKALGHFTQAAKKSPDWAEAHYGRLILLWETGDFATAHQVVSHLLKLNPRDETASYYQALSATKIGRPVEETLPVLRDLIKKRGADPLLFATLADEYVRADLDDLAVGWAKKSLKLNPDQRPVLDLLLDALPDYGDPDLRRLLDAYLETHPQDQDILVHQAHVLFVAKEYPAAREVLLKLSALGRRSPALLRGLAFTWRVENNWNEALLVYKDLLVNDPKDPETLSGIILCLVRSGRTKLALDFAKKALKQGHSSPLLHYHLGQIHLAVKDWSQALASFRTVLQDWPQHWQSVEKLAEVYQAMGDDSNAKKFRHHAANMKEKARRPTASP